MAIERYLYISRNARRSSGINQITITSDSCLIRSHSSRWPILTRRSAKDKIADKKKKVLNKTGRS